MEKVVYALWRDEATTGDDLRDALRTTAAALLDAGALRAQVNVADAPVAPGDGLRQTTAAGPFGGFVGVWVDTANDARRAPIDALIAHTAGVARSAAYLVTESEPLRNTEHPATDGRSWGFTQVVCLRRPARLGATEWLEQWHGHHTTVAIETQSTVRYVQNVVARVLTPGAPAIDGIVEETFPIAALDDPQVFFAAAGDASLLAANLDRMVASVSAFLDLDDLDVLPTSEYVVSSAAR